MWQARCINIEIMDLSKLTTRDLTQISRLLLKKETVQAQIDEINRQLETFGNGKPYSSKIKEADQPAGLSGRSTRKRRAKRAGRGEMKERIVEELKTAGKTGRHFKELAEKLEVKYGNISVWFQSTGKNIPEIKKVGPARFAWIS
jgi:hypothetical protein